MIDQILRWASHIFFGIRKYNNRMLRSYAKDKKGKSILEIGSGRQDQGADYYTAKSIFDVSNIFLQTDINPKFGHRVFDILNPDIEDKFDVILCMNVLEHIYEYPKAVENIRLSLNPNGEAVFFVPTWYPLHDEPNDYWRFTEHSLRKILNNFSEVDLKYSGIRKMPVAIFVIAKL